MRLTNTTDIPNEVVREIIKAVRPPGIAGFDVSIKNHGGRGACGVAYTEGSSYHSRRCPFVVVRVARTERMARRRVPASKRGYLPHEYGGRVEALLFVLAHELRHLWQAKHSRGKVWGARGRFSERDADAYAKQMLRRFRRGEIVCTKE